MKRIKKFVDYFFRWLLYAVMFLFAGLPALPSAPALGISIWLSLSILMTIISIKRKWEADWY